MYIQKLYKLLTNKTNHRKKYECKFNLYEFILDKTNSKKYNFTIIKNDNSILIFKKNQCGPPLLTLTNTNYELWYYLINHNKEEQKNIYKFIKSLIQNKKSMIKITYKSLSNQELYWLAIMNHDYIIIKEIIHKIKPKNITLNTFYRLNENKFYKIIRPPILSLCTHPNEKSLKCLNLLLDNKLIYIKLGHIRGIIAQPIFICQTLNNDYYKHTYIRLMNCDISTSKINFDSYKLKSKIITLNFLFNILIRKCNEQNFDYMSLHIGSLIQDNNIKQIKLNFNENELLEQWNNIIFLQEKYKCKFNNYDLLLNFINNNKNINITEKILKKCIVKNKIKIKFLEKDLIFILIDKGKYKLLFKIIDKINLNKKYDNLNPVEYILQKLILMDYANNQLDIYNLLLKKNKHLFTKRAKKMIETYELNQFNLDN